MTNLLYLYIESLYHNYDYVFLNAPRNTGKTTSFCKLIVDELSSSKKEAHVIFPREKYKDEYLRIFYRTLKKSIKSISKNRILFKNGSLILLKSIDKFVENGFGRYYNSNIYYFDQIYNPIPCDLLHIINLDSKIVFSDFQNNDVFFNHLSKMFNKKSINKTVNIGDLNVLLRLKKIEKIKNQLSSF